MSSFDHFIRKFAKSFDATTALELGMEYVRIRNNHIIPPVISEKELEEAVEKLKCSIENWSKVETSVHIIRTMFGEQQSEENLVKGFDLLVKFASGNDTDVEDSSSVYAIILYILRTRNSYKLWNIAIDRAISSASVAHHQFNPELSSYEKHYIHLLYLFFDLSDKPAMLLNVLSDIHGRILERITMIQMTALPSSERDDITKRLIYPLLYVLSTSMNDAATDWCDVLEKLMRQCHEFIVRFDDVTSASALLCTLLSIEFDSFNSFCSLKLHVTWQVIKACLLHTNILVRKRGAFALEKLSLLYQGSSCSYNWCADFLDVYRQIDGCTSLHLVQQVWPLFDRLNDFVALADKSADVAEEESPPAVDFDWIKALLYCLMRSQIPALRRAVIHRVLSGRLKLRICRDTAIWIVDVLVPQFLDSVTFFSAHFIDAGGNVGCAEAIAQALALMADLNGDMAVISVDTEPSFNAESTGVSTTNAPGALFPSFIARLLCVFHRVDRSTNEYIIRKLVHLCSTKMQSLSAIKFIVRAFADAEVRPFISRCLSATDLDNVRSFFTGHLSSSNGQVRDQVLRGMIPLVICAASLSVSKVEVGVEACIGKGTTPSELLFRLLFFDIGIDYILSLDCHFIATVFSLLRLYVIELANFNRSEVFDALAQIERAAQDSKDIYVVPFLRALMSHSEEDIPAVTALDRIFDSQALTISILYRSPYQDRSLVLSSLWFLQGYLHTIHTSLLLHQRRQQSAEACAQLFSLVVSYERRLLPSVVDVASFLASNIRAALLSCCCSTATLPTTVFITSVEYLQLAVSTLGELSRLLLRRYDDFDPRIIQSSRTAWLYSVCSTLALFSETMCDMRYANNSLARVISVVSADILLRSLASSLSPSDSHDGVCGELDGIARLAVEVFRVSEAALTLSEPRASEFHSMLEQCASPVPPNELFINFVESWGRFSRCSASFVRSRWRAMRAAFDILVLTRSSKVTVAGVDVSDQSAQLALLALAEDQATLCPPDVLPDLLAVCLVATQGLLIATGDNIGSDVISRLQSLLATAWVATLGAADSLDLRIVTAFMRLALDATVLRKVHFDSVRVYFDEMYRLGKKSRPQLMQRLVSHLCSVWSRFPELMLPFFGSDQQDNSILDFLIYKEPKLDDHSLANEIVGNEGELESEACRIMLLLVLEGFLKTLQSSIIDHQLVTAMQTLVCQLFAMNLLPEFKNAAMIGSYDFGRKLRCWQALCILSPLVTPSILSDNILDVYFDILDHPCVHSIRVHIEIFGATLCTTHADVFIPRVLRELKNFNLSQQKLVSLFVILAHVVIDFNQDGVAEKQSERVSKSFSGTTMRRRLADVQQIPLHMPAAFLLRDDARLRQIAAAMIPWLCHSGLPRAVSQLILYDLIPLLTVNISRNEDNVGLYDIYAYLSSNKDTKKILARQRRFFHKYAIWKRCSVAGLLDIGVDIGGEIVPEHMLTVLADALKDISATEENNRCRSAVSFGWAAPISDTPLTLQSKVIPFDALQLTLREQSLVRARNATGRTRQQLVVCASLVEKATNLAGIARTCEIFAVQAMTVASKAVVDTDDFKGIAVSSEAWLDIKEVPEIALPDFLRSFKRKGYVILGLEQTDSSNKLGSASLEMPTKCVLLLGKEREGVPVELLQLVDRCIEIPQFGVIRSLNVHVSAALAIWEITKANTEFLQCAEVF